MRAERYRNNQYNPATANLPDQVGLGVLRQARLTHLRPHVAQRAQATPDKADILLVDDEPIVRKSLATLLKFEGYGVIEAKDGLEALLLWYAHKSFDLIITDVHMPGVLGPQLAEAVWMEQFTPVLYISGLPIQGLCATHVREGRAQFLSKPFQPIALRECIQRLLTIQKS